MKDDNKLEEYLSYGLYGTPEIKKDEKIRFLGSFRENVIKVLTFEDMEDEAGIFYLKLALKTSHIDKIIVHQGVSEAKRKEIMLLAKEKNLLFNMVSSTDFIGENALVLVSVDALNKKDIYLSKPFIPKKLKENLGQPICKSCLKIARIAHPDLENEFKKISFLGKILGEKCPVCEKREEK